MNRKAEWPSLTMAIHLNEVLQQMQMKDSKGNPQPFELEWYTASLTNNTGGELKHVKRAVLTSMIKDLSRISQGNQGKRRINEFANMHRNIMDKQAQPGARTMMKVHIRLIHRFNGQLVEW